MIANLEPAEQALADRLREWRRGWAKANGMPAFMVFPDSTLVALVRQCPTTRDGLLAVPGIGPRKAEQFGGALLRALAAGDGPDEAPLSPSMP